MKKTHKVVMLPTEKASDGVMWLNNNTIKPSLEIYFNKLSNWAGQHLYILSNEEIKEGDWYIDDTNSVRQSITSDKDYWDRRKDYKKIVATTDKSLGEPRPHSKALAYIQESFTQAYIKAYNEGNPITEVDLEIELHKWVGSTYPVGHRPTYQIKTRPDNTVIVHQSKMYSRDEVIKLIEKFDDSIPHDTDVDKWIQDNL